MRSPLLHFLLIGALLFVAARVWQDVGEGAAGKRRPLVVRAAQVDEIRRGAVAQLGRPPSGAELDAFIAAAVEDEMLYREALALGLGEHDAVVRRRLIQNMRFLRGTDAGDDEALYEEALELGMDESDPVVRRRLIQSMRLAIEARGRTEEPTDAELAEYLTRREDRFSVPTRVRFSQVFFDPSRRGEAAEHDARAALERRETEPLGDPFPAPVGSSLQSEREIEKLFGPGFAKQVVALEPGSWGGPVRSVQGFHLVLVEQRKPGGVQQLDTVRSAVRYAVLAERSARALAEALERLRESYGVQVELDGEVQGGLESAESR